MIAKRLWLLRGLMVAMVGTATYFLRLSSIFLHRQVGVGSGTSSTSSQVLFRVTNFSNDDSSSSCGNTKTLSGWLCESRTRQQQQQQQASYPIEDNSRRKGVDNRVNHSVLGGEQGDEVDDSRGCFRHNSRTWLDSPRLGNINETLMDEDYVRRTILDIPSLLALSNDDEKTQSSDTVTGQTLCPAQSRFRNLAESGKDDESARLWTVRLVYMAMHYHQHHLAIQEALDRIGGSSYRRQGRQNKHCDRALIYRGIGRFDFECPGAKYLVISLNENGLGANLRVVIIRGLLAGLIANRVVLFVNNSPKGHYVARGPWKLASCDRRDYQCFFMPPSPCTVTEEDMENAYSLSRTENRKLFREAAAPPGHEEDRVWRTAFGVPARDIPATAVHRLRNHSLRLVEGLSSDDPRMPTLRRAIDDMLLVGESGSNRDPVLVGLMLYAMRPNLEYATQMNEIYENITDGVDADYSIGLPIRG